MAVGDRLNIADKATLDSIKQDTSNLVFKDNKLKMLDFTGLNNGSVFPIGNKQYFAEVVGNKILIFTSNGTDYTVKIVDFNSNVLFSSTLGFTSAKYSNFLVLSDTKVLFMGMNTPAPYKVAFRILDIENLVFGAMFESSIASMSPRSLSYVNGQLYLVAYYTDGTAYYCYKFNVNLSSRAISTQVLVAYGSSFTNGGTLKFITYDSNTGKYYLFTDSTCLEIADSTSLDAVIANNLASGYIASFTVPTPYAMDLNQYVSIIGYRQPKIINGIMYYNTNIGMISPVGINLTQRAVLAPNQLVYNWLKNYGDISDGSKQTYLEYNGKPYYVYLIRSTLTNSSYYANTEINLTAFITSTALSNGRPKSYKIDLGTILRPLYNTSSCTVDCSIYQNQGIIYLFVNLIIIDGSNFNNVTFKIDITDIVQEVEARCLLE